MDSAAKPQAHALVRGMNAFTTYLSQDFLGGPRLLKIAWIINFQKFGTAFFVLALMGACQNWSTPAFVYLGLHGAYGFCWVLKDVAFPDPAWQTRVTFGGAFMTFATVLGPYWLAPFLLVSGVARTPTSAILGVCIGVHTLGVALMLSADAQKYFTLRVKRGLITTGMFKHTRNPNYLGEMMIYGSYALLVGHWLPWAVLAWVWSALFLVNMLMKDASMSRYPEWAAYKARTGLLLPRLFPHPEPAAAVETRDGARV